MFFTYWHVSTKQNDTLSVISLMSRYWWSRPERLWTCFTFMTSKADSGETDTRGSQTIKLQEVSSGLMDKENNDWRAAFILGAKQRVHQILLPQILICRCQCRCRFWCPWLRYLDLLVAPSDEWQKTRRFTSSPAEQLVYKCSVLTSNSSRNWQFNKPFLDRP